MKMVILICATLVGFIAATGIQAAETLGQPPNDAGCQVAWTMASPDGATLSNDKAVPYILDFTMVDKNNDTAMDVDEFKSACLAGNTKFWSDVPEAARRPCAHGSCCQGGICFCCP